MEAQKTLDCKGLNCPMPIVKTKKTLESMKPGEVLRIEATDKGSKSDMAAFSSRTGNELLETKEEGNKFIFYIRKK
ncbi:MAG: sulfurtransferase TusA family protein [Nitrospiraceae bacterium]|nr:MAG: sulfurtransferase TusA family protein [Nitrospiraceae bacterium]